MKIHIIGGPGSGKTTFAQQLSSRLHIPHYELDKIGWKYGDRMLEFIEETITIANQPDWVTEGIYLIWIESLLYQADYIVFLDASWPVAAWRIVLRHLTRSLHGTNPYPGLNGVRLLFKLLKFARSYYIEKIDYNLSVSASVYKYFEECRDTVKPPDPQKLLARFEKYSAVIPLTADFVGRDLERYKERVVIIKNDVDRERFFAVFNKM